ncbi:hypothetical protein BS50DRAFT_361787 [Corynespora cassiicola Philippines]|uniref:Uncharacterized protein n=1 Tax=Corynespora cassiicola Philippines TaxID=1448308 RepID=A0A2T2NTE3_CORCC|nr:hypothetical protein BS50DRAFT_361787 [Corynespora cassiicola Philippines]
MVALVDAQVLDMLLRLSPPSVYASLGLLSHQGPTSIYLLWLGRDMTTHPGPDSGSQTVPVCRTVPAPLRKSHSEQPSASPTGGCTRTPKASKLSCFAHRSCHVQLPNCLCKSGVPETWRLQTYVSLIGTFRALPLGTSTPRTLPPCHAVHSALLLSICQAGTASMTPWAYQDTAARWRAEGEVVAARAGMLITDPSLRCRGVASTRTPSVPWSQIQSSVTASRRHKPTWHRPGPADGQISTCICCSASV